MDTMILPPLALNEPDFWLRQELLNGLFGIQSIGNQRTDCVNRFANQSLSSRFLQLSM